MFSALYRYWLKSKVHYSRLYILCSACSLYMFCMFLLHALHVPPACSTCSFYMFSMFKGHVQHVPSTCSVCSKYMFYMYFLHVLHVQRTCSACTFCLFSMFKVDVLLVPFACSVCHFTFTLRTSVSHNSLKSSPIYTIFIYLSSLYWDLDVHIACEEILWIFLSSSFLAVRSSWAPITSSFLHIIA